MAKSKAKEWCVWSVELNKVALTEIKGHWGFSYPEAKSHAADFRKFYGGNFEVRVKPENYDEDEDCIGEIRILHSRFGKDWVNSINR